MDQKQWLYRKKLTSSPSYTRVIEFSDDGSLLIAGGYNRSNPLYAGVMVWNRDQLLDSTRKPTPAVTLINEPLNPILSLAIAPDNSRIFTGEKNSENLFVYDTQR